MGSHQVLFTCISKKRRYFRVKYRRKNIRVFFDGLAQIFSGHFFRFPYIFSERFEKPDRKSSESKTNLYIQ